MTADTSFDRASWKAQPAAHPRAEARTGNRHPRILRVLAGVCLGAGLLACAADSYQRVPLPSQTVELADPAHCRVYVARSSQVRGAIRELRVYDGDTEIGCLGPGDYLCWERAPGRSLLRVVYEGPEIDRGDLEELQDFSAGAGEVRYFAVTLKRGGEDVVAFGKKTGSPLLQPLTAQEGRKLVSECDPAEVR